jgi:hypothetical protein
MKSVPSLLFFKPMKEEPPSPDYSLMLLVDTTDRSLKRCIGKLHWCIVDGLDILVDQGKYFSAPYRPGEKHLDKSTGKVVTVLSCEPVRVSEVTVADAERLGVVAEWDSLSANQQENLKEKYMRDAIGEDDLFYLLWHKRHPGKEWAWRVEGEEVTR